MRIKELIRWNSCGVGKAEQYAKFLAGDSAFSKINSHELNTLFYSSSTPLKAVDNEEYYIYYNYHSSSGYSTHLYVDDNNEIKYKIDKPNGMVFCAFFSEVIVFTLSNKW